MSEINMDTIPVREGEELDKENLQRFIVENIEEAPKGSLEIKQFGAGHSNLTYLLKINNWEAVLRRPPHGPVAPKAHDMEREYQFLSALHRHFSISPKPYVYSDDENVVGRSFFIMERKKGIVLNTEFPRNIKYTEKLGRKISKLMVDHLVKLHHINYQETGLVHLTKPEGFMERQITGWINRYERSKTNEIPNIEHVISFLSSHLPKKEEATIIHYDYKLNNTMFSHDFEQVVGLFDWEMSTVGDPLADLAVAMSYWIEANDNDTLKYGLGHPPVTVMDGFFTREEFVNEYARKSGRDVSAIEYYMTFAYFKLAVIGQQIYYRYKKGQTKDKRFAQFDVLINNIIQQAYKSI